MSASTSLPIDVDRRGDVWDVSLNRPSIGNAYDSTMIGALQDLADEVARELPRVVVLRGRGRHFQVGADLRWMSALRLGSTEDNLEASRSAARMFASLDALPCVVVAAVHGACLGGGTGLIAGADVVIATSEAFFSVAEVRWGLQPGVIVPQLNDAIGVRQARRYALTGERFGADEARRIGLVHKVVAPDQLDAAVQGIVHEVLANSPAAVRTTKKHLLEISWSAALSEPAAPGRGQLDALATSHATTRMSAEAGEGMTAFSEGRDPRWTVASTHDEGAK